MKTVIRFFTVVSAVCLLVVALDWHPDALAQSQAPTAIPAPVPAATADETQKIQNATTQVRATRPARPVIDPRKATAFKASVITSQMLVTVTKDENVPVKATFNLMSGSVDLSGTDPAVKIVIDVTSWNSNLLERDDRVRKLFFHSDEPGYAMMAVTVSKIDSGMIDKLRTDGKVSGMAVTGTLSFNGQVHPVAVQLNLGYNERGRLAVITAVPAVIKISEWGFSERLKLLMQACGHKSVADEVGVEFAFEFEAVK